jgi:uncharacterized protein YjbJ (UPF0337 family)
VRKDRWQGQLVLLELDTQGKDGYDMADMPKNTDDAKGRIKEAAGAITGNERLESEGKSDQLVGNVKDAVEGAVDSVRDGLDKIKDKI